MPSLSPIIYAHYTHVSKYLNKYAFWGTHKIKYKAICPSGISSPTIGMIPLLPPCPDRSWWDKCPAASAVAHFCRCWQPVQSFSTFPRIGADASAWPTQTKSPHKKECVNFLESKIIACIKALSCWRMLRFPVGITWIYEIVNMHVFG